MDDGAKFVIYVGRYVGRSVAFVVGGVFVGIFVVWVEVRIDGTGVVEVGIYVATGVRVGRDFGVDASGA